MSCDKKPLWKRALVWLLLTILGAIIGSCFTYTQSHYLYPFWAKVTSAITGKRCCYKVPDPIPVEVFSRQMSKLIKENYTITFTPEVTKVKIAHGEYECQKTFIDATKHVLDQNSGNLKYDINTSKKIIHIYSANKKK